LQGPMARANAKGKAQDDGGKGFPRSHCDGFGDKSTACNSISSGEDRMVGMHDGSCNSWKGKGKGPDDNGHLQGPMARANAKGKAQDDGGKGSPLFERANVKGKVQDHEGQWQGQMHDVTDNGQRLGLKLFPDGHASLPMFTAGKGKSANGFGHAPVFAHQAEDWSAQATRKDLSAQTPMLNGSGVVSNGHATAANDYAQTRQWSVPSNDYFARGAASAQGTQLTSQMRGERLEQSFFRADATRSTAACPNPNTYLVPNDWSMVSTSSKGNHVDGYGGAQASNSRIAQPTPVDFLGDGRSTRCDGGKSQASNARTAPGYGMHDQSDGKGKGDYTSNMHSFQQFGEDQRRHDDRGKGLANATYFSSGKSSFGDDRTYGGATASRDCYEDRKGSKGSNRYSYFSPAGVKMEGNPTDVSQMGTRSLLPHGRPPYLHPMLESEIFHSIQGPWRDDCGRVATVYNRELHVLADNSVQLLRLSAAPNDATKDTRCIIEFNLYDVQFRGELGPGGRICWGEHQFWYPASDDAKLQALAESNDVHKHGYFY